MRSAGTGGRVVPAVRLGVSVVVAAVLALCGCGLSEHLPPIPDGIPPGPGAPVPAIDLDAPGRTAACHYAEEVLG